MDLSVLIPARNEMFLQRTIEDVLAHARAETEVIAVLDGEWPGQAIPDHPRLRLTHSATVIGQRAATNLAARMSTATYVMKLDAHCSVEDGFDVTLIAADRELGRPDITQIPAMYNLHAFNWKCRACGRELYQCPTPRRCEPTENDRDLASAPPCGSDKGFDRVMYWDLLAGGVRGSHRRSEFWRFDQTLHFQYWHDYRKRPEAKGELVDVMSSVGACFFMRRERFHELGGLDEAHGSWGQFGTEIACKSWLSGGRHIVNKRTWFAHLFRTQGGDFTFPYPNPGSQIERARAHSRRLWIDGTWSGAKYPLSWLLQKFAPVPDWPAQQASAPAVHVQKKSPPTKGLVYYTDNELDGGIANPVRQQLSLAAGDLPIVAVARGCAALWDDRFPTQEVFVVGERGPLTMFRQILAGLEQLETDIAFLVEHDVLYAAEHFAFTPPRADRFYFNQHRWQVSSDDGRAVHYRASQTSGCCAYRALLVEHYRARIAHVEQHGYDRNLGYEPGTNRRSRELHPFWAETWFASRPNVDIRHGRNLSKSKWSIADFRNKANAIDWTEADAVPGWGHTRGRFWEWLSEAVCQPNLLTTNA